MQTFLKYSALASLLALAACEQVITVDLPEVEPALAVTAFYDNQDDFATVYVSRTVGILDNTPVTAVNDATVELRVNGQAQGNVSLVQDGLYIVQLGAPIGGAPATLELRVSSPSFAESASASQANVRNVALSGFDFEREAATTIDERQDVTRLRFSDPAGEDNYYIVRALVVAPSDFGDSISYYAFPNSFDPNAEISSDALILRDLTFDGENYELQVLTPSSVLYDENMRLYIEFGTISKDLYTYQKSLAAYNNSFDNPFAEPVTLFSNMSGGLGLFGLRSLGRVRVR